MYLDLPSSVCRNRGLFGKNQWDVIARCTKAFLLWPTILPTYVQSTQSINLKRFNK